MRDFIVSPGFAGVAAMLAVIVAAVVVLFAVRRSGKRSERLAEQREHDLAQTRSDAEHERAVARCWERWQWVVDQAGIEPAVSEGATLGLGPAVTLELLRGLLRDAEALGDDTLARAVAMHLEQVTLVLAQQAGPISTLDGAATTRLPVVAPEPQPAPASHRQPDPTPETAAAEAPPAPSQETGGRRRRK